MTLNGKKIVVTGGAGFLGRYVVSQLRAAGAEVVAPRKRDYDLVERASCRRLLDDHRPDVVVHLAARVGGIGANRENPGAFFFENVMMGVQLIEECRLPTCPRSSPWAPSGVPEAHARPVQRGGALGRLSRGDERPLRAGEEDAAGSRPGVSSAVWDGRHSPPTGQPLRSWR